MTLDLHKMDERQFDDYLSFLVPDYAQDLSKNFILPIEKATEDSKNLMKDLFPEKHETEGQFVHNIYCTEVKDYVGVVWYSIELESRQLFIYHVYINERYRRMGYASSVLQELEGIAKDLGATSMGLSVFGSNEHAYNLYNKLGYQTSSISMNKNI